MDFFIEMRDPGQDEWVRIEPASSRVNCMAFIQIAAAPAIFAGCQFRLVDEKGEPTGDFWGRPLDNVQP